MPLTEELISQFVKATKDDKQESREETVYGTIVEYNDSKYLKIDGSELLTPISSTANVKDKERVTALIKNHTVTVTGNLSNPSASTGDVVSVSGKISEFENIIADTVTTEQLEAESARIDNIIAGKVVISGTLTAESAEIKELQADNATIKGTLNAQSADIKDLKANSLTAESADVKYANIDFANIGSAAMEYFYAQSGLIQNVTVGDQTITGNLVGVTISGDLIEGNTVVAEKLVIKGSDGLYYKLNTDGMNVEAQQTDYNSLNGSVIKAKSITATKISVKDLVAFDATIGGFNITSTSLYSGTKESVGNTTRGVYLDSTGQIAFGDTSNYIKFFKDSDGIYKLMISADTICLSSGKDIDSAISDLENRIIESGTNVTYVQFTQPTAGMNVGDIWVKTINNTTWSTLKGKTWTEVKASLWGELGYSDQPTTYVWNGSKWVLTVDYNVVQDNKTSITQTRNEISLKADKTTVSALSERVTKNSTEIKQTAEEITLKADKSELDKLTGTVTEHSTQITQNAEAITLKADWTEVESLIGVVNKHGTSIEQNATQIALKANKTTVDSLGKTVSAHTTSIEQNASNIALKADKTTVDTLSKTVNSQGTSISQNASNIALKADKTTVDALGNTVASHTTSIQQNATQIALKANKTDPAGSVSTSTVTINADGVNIATGGTFTVESGNFDVDASGNMSAQNAYLSGDIYVNGSPALSQKNIYVGTNAPSNPVSGMVWIKPDTSTSAQTTFTKVVPWSSRVHMVNTPKTGSLTGTATAAVGTKYTYRIKVPVYLSPHTGTPTGAVLHFELATTSGGSAAVSATKNVTITDYGSGNKVIEMEVTGGSWIGNQSTLYFSLYTTTLSGYYAYNVLNSSDTSAAITVECISTSSSGASGWRDCAVFCYA